MAEKNGKKERREYGPMQKLGALWPKDAKSGVKYFEGRIAPEAVVDGVELTPDTKIILFTNDSENPQAPKFNVFVRQPKKNGEKNGAAKDDEVPF